MKELVEWIVRSLVKNPEAVTVTVVRKGGMEIYQVHVAPEDMGKVIEGGQGVQQRTDAGHCGQGRRAEAESPGGCRYYLRGVLWTK